MARPRSDDKISALLQAAAEIIAVEGPSASTASIARRAGVAEGTLFRYFATKDVLLNALFVHLKRDVREATPSMDGDGQAEERLRLAWEAYVDWGIAHPDACQALAKLTAWDRLTAETHAEVDALFPDLRRFVASILSDGAVAAAGPAFADAIFVGLAETALRFSSADPAGAPRYKAAGFEILRTGLLNLDNE